jgi:hypothetical protein
MRLLRELFLKHTGQKIVALAIALSLWGAYNSEPVVETAYSAPILLVNIPSGLEVAGEVPAAAVLRIRGRLGPMRRIDPSGISLSADCSAAGAGTQVIRLTPNIATASNSPETISITPPQIEISLVSASSTSHARN